jgi:dihydrodipicolinate synthase/N-acetylneuraminate lyase
MKTKSGFFGVYPVVYALFDEKGNLARDPMRRQVQSMLKHRVHGIGVLGLASEVNKLSTAERRQLMEWVAEDIDGKAPLAVTVAETSVGGQIEFVKAAAAIGAKWTILQPPQVKHVPESELVHFFGAVADASPIPIAIQNAPEYLGIGLSHAGIRTLHRVHPNFTIVKLEATAIAVARLLEEVEGEVDVFNGRDGIEMLDSMRAGAVGIIPGGEAFDVLARAFDHMASGTVEGGAEAERLYAKVLPLLIMLMESMDTFLVYGKPVLGHRLGIAETKPRLPSTPPTAFGLAAAKRYAEMLGKL